MRITLLIAVLTAGCAFGEDDVATGTVEQALCPKFGCGGDNSPWIAGAYFHDLNRAGVPNAEGFTYLGFYDLNYQPYSLQVVHGRLSGVSSVYGTISGLQLVGARMRVSFAGVQYAIRIDAVTSVAYWANPGANPPPLEAYLFSYSEWRNPGRSQPLCHNSKPESPDNLTMANNLAYYTLVFERDRIDDEHKLVTIDDTGNWFNLACAGGAPAKMYLTGHTMVAAFDGFQTTVEERQTILKMFTADYCGDGTPFTVAGQPLTWADDKHWMTMLQSATTLDARWTSNGAACIGTPRTAVQGTPAWTAFPGMLTAAEISNACPNQAVVPECANLSLDLDGFHIASANHY